MVDLDKSACKELFYLISILGLNYPDNYSNFPHHFAHIDRVSFNISCKCISSACSKPSKVCPLWCKSSISPFVDIFWNTIISVCITFNSLLIIWPWWCLETYLYTIQFQIENISWLFYCFFFIYMRFIWISRKHVFTFPSLLVYFYSVDKTS